MIRPFSPWGHAVVLFFCLLALAACSRHGETVRRVNELVKEQQYIPALDELTIALRKDPKSAELLRLRVMVWIHYERVDMAYADYKELEKLSPDDGVLLNALKDKDPKVRAGSARVLGLVATPSAIQKLEKLLADPDRDVRRATVSALGDIRDSRATKGLVAALKDEWWFVRSDAAQALGKIRDVSAAEPLFGVLGDSDSSVSLASENALLTLARVENAPHDVYARYVNDANPEIRRVALLSLAIMRDHSVAAPLVEMAGSPDSRKRAQAVRALGILQDPAGLAVVRKATGDNEPIVRLQAVEALGEFHDADSVALLKNIAANESEAAVIRRAAMISLVKISRSNSAP